MDFLNQAPSWCGRCHQILVNVWNLQAAEPALTLDEARLFLRADSGDEDETIQRLIEASTDYFEIRTGWRLAPASYEARLGCTALPLLAVPRGPVRAVQGVAYWDDATKLWVDVDAADYMVDGIGNEFRIELSTDIWPNLPVASPGPSGLPWRVRFLAGFDPPGQTETAIGFAPSGMVQALKGLVALGFQKREAGDSADADKDQLLRGYRKFW